MNNIDLDAIRTMSQLIDRIASGESVVVLNRQNTKNGYWIEIETDARSKIKERTAIPQQPLCADGAITQIAAAKRLREVFETQAAKDSGVAENVVQQA